MQQCVLCAYQDTGLDLDVLICGGFEAFKVESYEAGISLQDGFDQTYSTIKKHHPELVQNLDFASFKTRVHRMEENGLLVKGVHCSLPTMFLSQQTGRYRQMREWIGVLPIELIHMILAFTYWQLEYILYSFYNDMAEYRMIVDAPTIFYIEPEWYEAWEEEQVHFPFPHGRKRRVCI